MNETLIIIIRMFADVSLGVVLMLAIFCQYEQIFITCKVFGSTAKFMSTYMGKGSQIALEGRIQTGNYEKDGVKRYTTDVMVEDVYFADSKKTDNGSQDSDPVKSDGFIPMESDDELPF